MGGNDLVRQSALDKPRYDEKFWSSFFDAEAFLALGLFVKDLQENDFRVGVIASEASRDAAWRARKPCKRPLVYFASENGWRSFGERCNVRLHIPKEWPAHMPLKSLLNSCNKVTTEEVKQAKTFANQN
jgi:hypothetical protein